MESGFKKAEEIENDGNCSPVGSPLIPDAETEIKDRIEFLIFI